MTNVLFWPRIPEEYEDWPPWTERARSNEVLLPSGRDTLDAA